MTIFKRGGVYWFEFRFNGQRITRSTRQGNLTIARQIEAAFRTQLAKGEVGIETRKRIPTFREFAKRFLDHMRVHCAAKPRTFSFWEDCTNRLLKYEPIANARLDRIDEGLIAKYVEKHASKARPGTVNRSLAALRRALRLAQ